MTFFSRLAGAASALAAPRRSRTDPRIIRTGPGTLDAADRVAKGLGWFSIGLGVFELVAPRVVTGALGLRRGAGLVRLFGLREIGTGVLTLSPDKRAGLWMRVAGDVLDLAAVMASTRRAATLQWNGRSFVPARSNADQALLMLAGVLVVDLAAATLASARASRLTAANDDHRTARRLGARSGFPQGVEAARGAARDAEIPSDMRAAPQTPADLRAP